MKSIMIICNSLGMGGAEKHTVTIANGLYESGWQVVLVYLSDHHYLLSQLKDGVREHAYYLPRDSRMGMSTVLEIKKLLADYDMDKILAVNQMSLRFALLARGLSFRIKVFASCHTTKPRAAEAVVFYLSSWVLYKLANKVIYVCKNQMDYWQRRMLHIGRQGLFIYNGVDTAKFAIEPPTVSTEIRQQLQIVDDALVLVSLAMLRPEKRHVDMLDLIEKLTNRGENAYLLCVGDGPMKDDIVSQAKDLAIEDRIKMIGLVDDVRPYLATSDGTLMLSNAVETFSIAVLESLSCGCPVFAYDIGGIKEQITQGQHGVVLKQGDHELLLEKLIALQASKHMVNKQDIHSYINDNFSEKKMIAEYDELLAS